ncbi:MAG: TIM barrel protein [SAR202 cluster bacterium]|nr:TIM barrel protein [SAR202 cluster bacterium]
MLKIGALTYFHVDGAGNELVDIESFLHFATRIGLDMVDIALEKGFKGHSSENLSRIKQLCVRYGLPIGYVTGGGGFVGTEEEIQERLARAKEAVRTAVFLGAPIVLLHGSGLKTESYWPRMIDAYKQMCDYAEGHGIVIGIHGHGPPKHPKSDEILNIRKDVGRDNTTIILDTAKWEGWREGPAIEELYGYMEDVAPYASHVRAKIFKIDTGKEIWIDYERVLKILKSVDYHGPLSIYWMGFRGRNQCTDQEGMAKAAQYLRDLVKTY